MTACRSTSMKTLFIQIRFPAHGHAGDCDSAEEAASVKIPLYQLGQVGSNREARFFCLLSWKLTETVQTTAMASSMPCALLSWQGRLCLGR